jgi:hypothetical protein
MESLTRLDLDTHQSERNFSPKSRDSVGQSASFFTTKDVSMYKRKGSKSRTRVAPTIWSAISLLDSARRLNQRCFELLATTALRRPDERSPVFARGDLWARIDVRGIERAGRCPVLLLNLHFHELDWWQRVTQGSMGPLLRNARPPLFEAEEVAPLLRALLTEAWSTARVNVFAASLLFGMAPSVAKSLANLTAYKIDQIVSLHATAVRPRWEESRTFWIGLLEAAVNEHSEPLTRVQLHALHLLGSETTPRHV